MHIHVNQCYRSMLVHKLTRKKLNAHIYKNVFRIGCMYYKLVKTVKYN